ncbi:MAG: hypothetical protein AAF500_12715 [Myxococcota bacterium]
MVVDMGRLARLWHAAFILAPALATPVSGCTEPTEPSPIPSLAPLPAVAADTPADPYLRSDSRFGTVHLHAGFNPDPRIVEGTAEGEISANTIHRRCRGWTSEEPDYLLSADTAFLQLNVLGRAEVALSLVLRKPNGRVVCKNSRSASRGVVLRTDLPLGTSQLWVSVAQEGASAPYRLGFSEVSSRPTSIPAPEDPAEPAAAPSAP